MKTNSYNTRSSEVPYASLLISQKFHKLQLLHPFPSDMKQLNDLEEKNGVGVLVVFAPNLKIASRVTVHWAFLRCFDAFINVTAVSAFPLDWRVFLEHFSLFHVFQQFQITSFVVCFHFCNHAEGSGYFAEAFLFSYVCKVGVKCYPLKFFSFSCSHAVCSSSHQKENVPHYLQKARPY
jgi:hypothetical protein